MLASCGLSWLAALSVFAATTGPVAAEGGGDVVSAYQWKARVLLVVAPRAGDPQLTQQRAMFNAMGRGAGERDLKLVTVVDETAQAAAIRARFNLEDANFHAILVGKDGGDKLVSAKPIGADVLFPLIDSMPMRQDEMRE